MTWKMLVEAIICQQEKQNRQNRMHWYASFPFFSPRLFFFFAIGRKKKENKENKSESLLIEKTKKQKIHAFYP
jgi:hypothetical protein